ncbi:uncharacterized protein LOC142029861 isoform X3 [Buteo buteo]|uniref:uncharacterized protein LOC142029861 isoform X3 n=1 Tax=Buteo buteo TaxID=30397 RepID=UPI003EB96EB8
MPREQPALLPDPEGTPLPFPPAPTPAQPQFPPSPPRPPPARLRAAPAAPPRHGPAAAPCVRHGPRRPARGFPRNPPGDCAAPPRGPVHQRGHKGDFFQREERVIKAEVHDLPFSFMKRERCEELCESRVTVLPENTLVPAGVRSTLDLVQSHLQGPI